MQQAHVDVTLTHQRTTHATCAVHAEMLPQSLQHAHAAAHPPSPPHPPSNPPLQHCPHTLAICRLTPSAPSSVHIVVVVPYAPHPLVRCVGVGVCLQHIQGPSQPNLPSRHRYSSSSLKHLLHCGGAVRPTPASACQSLCCIQGHTPAPCNIPANKMCAASQGIATSPPDPPDEISASVKCASTSSSVEALQHCLAIRCHQVPPGIEGCCSRHWLATQQQVAQGADGKG